MTKNTNDPQWHKMSDSSTKQLISHIKTGMGCCSYVITVSTLPSNQKQELRLWLWLTERCTNNRSEQATLCTSSVWMLCWRKWSEVKQIMSFHYGQVWKLLSLCCLCQSSWHVKLVSFVYVSFFRGEKVTLAFAMASRVSGVLSKSVDYFCLKCSVFK